MFLANPAYANHKQSHVDVLVGELSSAASKGQIVFNTTCASCHGVNASGGVSGPPLIHNIYNPGHHGNQSFINAVRNGVRRHHWNFGDMPPQKHHELSSSNSANSVLQAIRSTVSGVIPSSGVTRNTRTFKFSGAFRNFETIIEVSKSVPMVRTWKESTISAIEDNSCFTSGSKPWVETEMSINPRFN